MFLIKSGASQEAVGSGLSPEDLEKLANTFKKIGDLEKLVIMLQGELKVFEDAKVISSLQLIQVTITGMPRKEDMSKVEREISKLKDGASDSNDDFKNLRAELHELRNLFTEYKMDNNKDVGGLKGGAKYCED